MGSGVSYDTRIPRPKVDSSNYMVMVVDLLPSSDRSWNNSGSISSYRTHPTPDPSRSAERLVL